MVEYSDQLNKLMSALFPPKQIENGMGDIIAHAGLKQLRIAETEKYPHVTFFFNWVDARSLTLASALWCRRRKSRPMTCSPKCRGGPA